MPNSPLDALNALFAMPWDDLVSQYSTDAHAGELYGWTNTTGRQTVAEVLHYEASIGVIDAEWNLSVGNAPGYEKVADDSVVVAAPLQATWRVSLSASLRARFRVWADTPVGTETVLDIGPTLPLRIDLGNLRVLADVAIDAADRDRPRLHRVSVSPQFTIDLYGCLPVTGLHANQFAVAAAPGGVYQLETWLSDLAFAGIPDDVRGPYLDGRLIVTLAPELRIEIDGVMRFDLPRVAHVQMPFAKFSVGTGIHTSWLTGLLDLPANVPGELPRQWPPAWPPQPALPQRMKLEEPPASPPFLEDAATLEQRMQVALPRGQVYEVAIVAAPSSTPSQPSLPPRGRPAPSQPPMPHFHFVYKTFDDTALWTGFLLAAQAFRIAGAATPSEKQAAIDSAGNVMTGIRHLFDITQTPGLPARASLPRDSPIKADPPFNDPPADVADRYYGPVAIDGEPWYGFGRGSHPTSRDSFAGLMFGLACVLKLVDEPALTVPARAILASTVKFLVDHHFNVPTRVLASTAGRPGGGLAPPFPTRILTNFLGAFEYQLMVLRIGKSLAADPHADAGVMQASTLYDTVAPAAAVMWPPLWFSSFDPIQQYFKFNLEHAVLATLLMLEDDATLRSAYERSFRIVRRATQHHRNAFFNLVTALVALPADRAAVLAGQSGYDPDVSLADEIRAELWEWHLRWNAIAGHHGLPTEATPDPDYLAARYPDDVREYTPMPGWDAGVTQKGSSWASLFALPVHKRPGSEVDFIWQRSPFSTDISLGSRPNPDFPHGTGNLPPGGAPPGIGAAPPPGPNGIPSPGLVDPKADPGNPLIESAGVDYFLPVWMAKYLGVI